MRRVGLLTITISIGLVLCTICLKLISSANAPLVSQSSGIPKLIVDDFEDGFDRVNNLDGPTSCWAQNGGAIDCTSDFEGSQGRLKMTYDVSASKDAYALYSSNLISLNATDLDAVWVGLYGVTGDEKLYVELKDCGLHGLPQYPKEKVDDYLAKGIITDSWSAAVIPLTAFEAITDLTCIDQVNVLAHNNINSGKGTVLIDNIQFLPERVIIDDFEDQDAFNQLGGFTGFWNNPENQNHITYTYSSGELKLAYDVRTSDSISEAIYWTDLQNSGVVERKDVLTFDIRGEKGGEQVALEFSDCGLDGEQHIPKVKVSDYLPSGITTVPQRVSIPRSAFGPDINWRCIKTLNILVSSQPWFDSEHGTVYIDNLELSPSADPPPLMVDNFSDCNGRNAMLKAWGAHSNPPATINAEVSRNADQGCAYRIDYSVVGNSGVWLISELGNLDVSKYNFLRFAISGTVGNEEAHVYLKDKQGKERYYENIRPQKNRTEVFIPLQFFGAAMDLTHLAEIRIAFEWKSMSGTVLIDDISFVYKEQKNYLPVVANTRLQPAPPMEPTPQPCEDLVPQCVSPGAYEPNNRMCSAIPLALGVKMVSEICGPTDTTDYFAITVTKRSKIDVRLSDIPQGADYDVYLYDSVNPQNVAGSHRKKVKVETFSYVPEQLGRYYIRVYRVNGYSEKPYILEATYE